MRVSWSLADREGRGARGVNEVEGRKEDWDCGLQQISGRDPPYGGIPVDFYEDKDPSKTKPNPTTRPEICCQEERRRRSLVASQNVQEEAVQVFETSNDRFKKKDERVPRHPRKQV